MVFLAGVDEAEVVDEQEVVELLLEPVPPVGGRVEQLVEQLLRSLAEPLLPLRRERRSAEEVDERMDFLWDGMNSCIERGMRTEGVLHC